MKVKEWLCDKLFLDFYLDKHWTFRFKLLNFLSGGMMLDCVCPAWRELEHRNDYDNDHWLKLCSKRADYWLNEAFKSWMKE